MEATVSIRKERPGDTEQIRAVNIRAFSQTSEADVIDILRKVCPEFVSRVAIKDDRLVGHILFTPAVVDAKEKCVVGMGLAPLAVLPDFQRQGIGSRLMRSGLEVMRLARWPFVLVLGHPGYYPRFGFVPASKYGIISEYKDVPEEAFMILVADEDALKGTEGIGKYRPEWAAAV
jgi:putative acetyltransferase